MIFYNTFLIFTQKFEKKNLKHNLYKGIICVTDEDNVLQMFNLMKHIILHQANIQRNHIISTVLSQKILLHKISTCKNMHFYHNKH